MPRPSPFPALLALAAALAAAPVAAQTATERTQKAQVRIETVTTGLSHPWGLAFLPDRRMLVTEREGRLRLVDANGQIVGTVAGTPTVVARGQGGLLDVVLSPDFAQSRLVYLTFAEAGEGGAGTAVFRGKLSADARRLEEGRVIWRQTPKVAGGNHFGSRLVFSKDGKLFVALGDRFNYRDQAQDLRSALGKVVRLEADGAIPKDNPFVGRAETLPEIWSYGHRNIQGATLDPATGELWTIEHGARGGDEINRPEAGKNYGWPVITYGVDYSGAKIGVGTAKEGMEQPLFYWDPSIAPSGAVIYTGDLFPAWKGSLFTGALAGQLLVRLERDGTKVVREERMLAGLSKRIRDVRQGPEGALYLLTDEENGAILRLRPAQ